MTPRFVDIHYRRPPDRIEVFRQLVLEETDEYVVTLLPEATLRQPVRVAGRIVLEAGAPVIWFTYPDQWYDVGRFHLSDGTFTGFYANVITPVQMDRDRWYITDLFLDVWVGSDGRVELLDRNDLEAALAQGVVDRGTARRAFDTAHALFRDARRGTWPPREALEWTLDRVRERQPR